MNTPDTLVQTTDSVDQGKVGGTSQNACKNQKRHQSRKSYESNEIKNFVGEIFEIDCVISLISEKLDKGTMFEKFLEKVQTYVLKNFDHTQDVLPLFTELEDQIADFETNDLPEDPSLGDQASVTKMIL